MPLPFTGFSGKTLPDLQRQEITSLLCLLRILYKIYTDETRVDDWQKTELYLHKLTIESFEFFLMLEEADRRGECWSDIVKLLLKKMALLDDTRVSH